MAKPSKSTTSKVKDLAPKSTTKVKGGGIEPCYRK